MKKKNCIIIRYADNIVFLEKTKNDAINALSDAEKFLKGGLSLNLNSSSKSINNIYGGFVFLGFLFKNRKKTIADVKIEKIKTKINKILRKDNNFSDIIDKLN